MADSSASTNITWHEQRVSREGRWKSAGHKGVVLWFTGMSGAGKSSVANAVEAMLSQRPGGLRTYLLDGDNVRHGLCGDLGFSMDDRAENIRRVGEVAKLMADSGCIVLAALISPYRRDRDRVRASVEGIAKFVEIHVRASLDTCEGRDPKGLYKMARAGTIKNFTGIDDPYEAPNSPEMTLESDDKTIEELAREVIEWLDSSKSLEL